MLAMRQGNQATPELGLLAGGKPFFPECACPEHPTSFPALSKKAT
jgi:hypothetical protein